jgi:hypothetical protein
MPRELIEPHKDDKRYVRRTKAGQFKESDDVGRSLSADHCKSAKKVGKKGEGDRGGRRR